MEFVYCAPSSEIAKLKTVLEADSLAKDSFATAGCVLKESSSAGLPAGKYFVHFIAEEPLASRLKERLAQLPEVQPASGEEKTKVCEAVAAEGEAAASGFGSIFG